MSGPDRLYRRRWSFADCIFDEANWALIVDGRRVTMEIKPLELLRELLQQAGNLVSKKDLLDAIWPNVVVVEASLATAVRKLRFALNDDHRPQQIIETVSRIGYRIAVPVEVEALTDAANGATTAGLPAESEYVRKANAAVARPVARRNRAGRRRLLAISGGLAIATVAAAITLALFQQAPAATAARSFSQRDVESALRRLDVAAIERMLAAGLDPNRSFDREGNGAVNYVLNICEWDRGHDRGRMLLMVRTLYEGGARYENRNVWGDTSYSIAKSPRYCGPNHPVTRSIRATCYAGFQSPGDRCLASYELARRNAH